MPPVEGRFFRQEGACDLVVHPGVVCYQASFDSALYDDRLFDSHGVRRSAAVAGAVIKRKAEFFAGRYVAQRALQRLGIEGVEVGTGSHGSPAWPSGIVGSITHIDNRAVVAVAPASLIAAIGIDVEKWIAPARVESIRNAVLAPGEEAMLDATSLPFTRAFTLAFSAKESLFKALYPSVRRYFDFGTARLLDVDVPAGILALELLSTLTRAWVRGAVLSGRFVQHDDGIFTSILWDCSSSDERSPRD